MISFKPADCLKAVERLSPRQREILRLLAEGLANKQIAAQLAIAEDTVNSHRRMIYTTLDVGCTAHAVVVATKARLI